MGEQRRASTGTHPARRQPRPAREQDRSRWNRESINEGITLITHTLARGPLDPYQVQAAIAARRPDSPLLEPLDTDDRLFGLNM